jgi:hypothetical protein
LSYPAVCQNNNKAKKSFGIPEFGKRIWLEHLFVFYRWRFSLLFFFYRKDVLKKARNDCPNCSVNHWIDLPQDKKIDV